VLFACMRPAPCWLTTRSAAAGSPWTLEVRPDGGHAAHSTVSALPPQLAAGRAEAVTVTARDAAGNATAGGDRVELLLDSAAEGRCSIGRF
jgi:hypothetical protein